MRICANVRICRCANEKKDVQISRYAGVQIKGMCGCWKFLNIEILEY